MRSETAPAIPPRPIADKTSRRAGPRKTPHAPRPAAARHGAFESHKTPRGVPSCPEHEQPHDSQPEHVEKVPENSAHIDHRPAAWPEFIAKGAEFNVPHHEQRADHMRRMCPRHDVEERAA